MQNVLFSNSIETLIEKLKTSLFLKKTFLKTKFIVVPNKEFEETIRYSFCKDQRFNGVFGVKFILKEELSKLLSTFYKLEKTTTRLEVSLYIEKLLDSYLENGIVDPLLDIIRKDPLNRKCKIAEELSEIFMKYALFNPKFFEGKKSFLQEIFFRVNHELPFVQISDKTLLKDRKIELHFFCLRYLPPRYSQLFSKTSADIFHYIASPTEHYWEDFVSDYEEKKILKKVLGDKKIVKQALQDKHPLLANFGVLQREYLKILNKDDFPSYEEYCEEAPNSVLENLKADIFYLNLEKKELEADDSVRVFQASSKLDEVLKVKALIEKSSSCLSQIGIYVPDIASYLPFFEMVFGNKIKVIGNLKQSELLEGLFDLIAIFEKGLNAKNFQKLLFNQILQGSFNFTKEEVYRITRWIENVRISDGWDLEKFNRIVLGLVIYVDKERHAEDYPLLGIENGDSELIDRLVNLVSNLVKDTKFAKENHSLEDWIEWLEGIENRYFSLEIGGLLKGALQSFKLDNFLLNTYSFLSILARLHPILEKKGIPSSPQAIEIPTLSSLKNNIACPYEETYLLGLNDDTFSYKKDPLDPMQYGCYCPCQKDQDTSFLLEALLFTSKKITFSYQKGANEALMLHQLLSYLENTYLLTQECLSKCVKNLHWLKEKKLSTWETQTSKEIENNEIRLEDLSSLTAHPIRFFIQKILRSDLEKTFLGKFDPTLEYRFDGRQKAFFRQDVLLNGYEKAFSEWKRADLFPSKFYLESIVGDLEEEGRRIESFLEKFSLNRSSFHKKILSEKIGSKQVSGSFLVFDRGFILKENSLDQVVKFWPMILSFCLTEKKDHVDLFFLEEEEKQTYYIESVTKEFSRLIDYYTKAAQTPSPMVRNLIKPILYEDEKAFGKVVEQTLTQGFSDPYLNLLFEKKGVETVYEDWNALVKDTFCDLMKNFEGLYEVI